MRQIGRQILVFFRNPRSDLIPAAAGTDSDSVMVGLDPAIGYPKPIANDAIPISNHPIKMTGQARS